VFGNSAGISICSLTEGETHKGTCSCRTLPGVRVTFSHVIVEKRTYCNVIQSSRVCETVSKNADSSLFMWKCV